MTRLPIERRDEILISLKTDVKYIRNDIKEIKENHKDLINKVDKVENKAIKTETKLNNHVNNGGWRGVLSFFFGGK